MSPQMIPKVIVNMHLKMSLKVHSKNIGLEKIRLK